jgi:hypothetical protein
MTKDEVNRTIHEAMAWLDASDGKYAVFEAIGEEWSQITVWLPVDSALSHLARYKNEYKDRCFYLLQRMGL